MKGHIAAPTAPALPGEDALAEAEEQAEEQARAARSVAPDRLRRVSLAGRVVTGDARDCQRTRCAPLRAADGP